MRAGTGLLLFGLMAVATPRGLPATTGAQSGARINPAARALDNTAVQRPTSPVRPIEEPPAPVRQNVRVPFRMRASVWTPAASDGRIAGRVWVVGELDGQTRKGLAWSLGGHGELTLFASDGSPIASREVELVARDKAFGLRMPEMDDLLPGDYSVRLRLHAVAEDSRLLVMGLPFNVPLRPMPLGEAVMWRRGPSTGLQHLRTADPRFRRNERLRLELPTASAAPARARMLDRVGKPLQAPPAVSTRADTSGDFQWVVVDAPMAPFAPGDYAIEVTQESSSQVAAISVIP